MTAFTPLGLTLADLCALTGETRPRACSWLGANGYRLRDGKVIRSKSAIKVEREIADRIAATPSSAPCWRCGCRVCEHQESAVA